MAQFDVFPNPNPASRDRIPYVVVLQSDLLEPFEAVVVAPLRVKNRDVAIPIRRLNPVISIDGTQHFLRPQEIAAVPIRLLKNRLTNLSAQRTEILAALDLLFTGL